MSTNRPDINNRKARHNYFVEDTLSCGIVLKGNEVKSLAASKANINDAWCSVENGQLILNNMYIAKYETANQFDVDERRDRILLAHKREITKLAKIIMQDGYTLIPLRLYWHKNYAKIEIGICKGKHNYDKREALKNKDIKRHIEQHMKARG